MKPPNFGSFGSWALIGAGTAGLAYLIMRGRTLQYSRFQAGAAPLAPGMTQGLYFSPETQQRVRQTMMYFGGGLGFTGAMVYALRNSTFAMTNPWILLFGSLGLLIGT